MYLLIDTVTKNILGECKDEAEAEQLFISFASVDVNVVDDLVIVSRSGAEHPAPREKLRETLMDAVSV